MTLYGLSGGLLAACVPDGCPTGSAAGGRAPAGQPRKGGQLTIATNGLVKLWDPAISLVIDEYITTKAIYIKLTMLDEKLQPPTSLHERIRFCRS